MRYVHTSTHTSGPRTKSDVRTYVVWFRSVKLHISNTQWQRRLVEITRGSDTPGRDKRNIWDHENHLPLHWCGSYMDLLLGRSYWTDENIYEYYVLHTKLQWNKGGNGWVTSTRPSAHLHLPPPSCLASWCSSPQAMALLAKGQAWGKASQ